MNLNIDLNQLNLRQNRATAIGIDIGTSTEHTSTAVTKSNRNARH